jgi:hypothetical protein
MNTMTKLGLGLCTALALQAMSADGAAAGIAVDANELSAKTRGSLQADIVRARIEVPELFRQVHEVAQRAAELDGAARRPGTPLTMHFKALGPRALMPMLEMLAVDAHAPRDLGPTARAALRVGLVEAVGIVRDARAVPVLARIALHERDVDTTRASADALGRMGSDEAFSALVAALEVASGERTHAILAGIGASRRVDGAKLLAKRLSTHPEAATARAVAKALGTAGNAWAWKTLTSRTDEATVREIAAAALVKAYVEYTGEPRTAALSALLVVDDPHTTALITEARRTASTDQATALDELAARLAKNPTR